jgi:hypothetical protein
MSRVPPSYVEWLKQSKHWFAAHVVGIGVPPISWAAAGKWMAVASWVWILTGLLAFQVIVIGLLLFLIPDPVDDPSRSRRATIAVHQFHAAWRTLWTLWLFEYVGLATWEGCQMYGLDRVLSQNWKHAVGTALNLLNNLPTVALGVCYIVASERTVVLRDGRYKGRHLPWLEGFAVVCVLAVAELVLRVMGVSFAEKLFTWGSGVAAGVATAIMVGRLDSKFIGLPTMAMIPLYGYAVIQSGWPSFAGDNQARAVLLNLALVLKVHFFAVTFWLFRSGVFLFYLEGLAGIYDRVSSERKTFLGRVLGIPDRRTEHFEDG